MIFIFIVSLLTRSRSNSTIKLIFIETFVFCKSSWRSSRNSFTRSSNNRFNVSSTSTFDADEEGEEEEEEIPHNSVNWSKDIQPALIFDQKIDDRERRQTRTISPKVPFSSLSTKQIDRQLESTSMEDWFRRWLWRELPWTRTKTKNDENDSSVEQMYSDLYSSTCFSRKILSFSDDDDEDLFLTSVVAVKVVGRVNVVDEDEDGEEGTSNLTA